tara:strand:+ start:1211 stop:1369 length:159 start_codon:yes stop_codon:yes gene_type:complete
MSYYLVVDDDPEFIKIEGPYRNKDDLLNALASKFGFTIFDTKREAREYLDDL